MENSRHPFNLYTLAALMLVAFSVALSVIVSRSVFERLPHIEDEVAYLYQAKVFASGELVAPTPEPANAYWQPFVVDSPETGARFSKYPPGWSALLALGVALGVPFVVNAFIAGLTVALVFRLGADAFGRDAGVIAAALTAFSPMALLLNATLMAHSAALCFTMLFVWAYWKIDKAQTPVGTGLKPVLTQPVPIRWGIVAGIALGMVLIIRPLTAVGVALPFIIWSILRLVRVWLDDRASLWRTLRPLVMLGAFTLIVGAAIPLYNTVTVGTPVANLYTLVWDYDRIGFGECCGRNGHTLEKGVQHMRYDLSLTAADLFGWQLGTFEAESPDQYDTRVPDVSRQCADLSDESVSLQEHLRTCSGYWRVFGVSWILLFPGLLAGFRRNWTWVWVALGAGWAFVLPEVFFTALEWWVAFGIAWALVPLAFLFPRMNQDIRANWTWLIGGLIFSLLAVHVAYWVGSQRYSTRYYYEALGAAAILSALPLAWLIRQVRMSAIKWVVYGGVSLVCAWSYFAYSIPRIHALYGFNHVTQAYIDTINAARQTDDPVLVMLSGDLGRTWRSHGALMAEASPFLDGDLVVAWVDDPQSREMILARFPDHEIIELFTVGDNAYFADTYSPDCPNANCIPLNDPAYR